MRSCNRLAKELCSLLDKRNDIKAKSPDWKENYIYKNARNNFFKQDNRKKYNAPIHKDAV